MKEVEKIVEVPVEVVKEVPVEVIREVEVIKEVPVEIIKEVEVVKSVDMDALMEMMKNAATVEVSKQVVGETRHAMDAKIVERREVTHDDLKTVEGIGPKIEELLNNAGIHSFVDLANTNPDHIRHILHEAGPSFQMHDPGTWPDQARLAAEGRWEELKVWQDELQGGK